MTSRSEAGCTFCGCGAWNRNVSASACEHEGEQRTAPRATKAFVCITCEHQADDWNAVMKHYIHTGHGFVPTEQPPRERATMNEKRFTAIKWNEKAVELEWTTLEGAITHDHQLSSPDEPHLEFRTALQALREDVLTIVEVEDAYGDGMRVQSVSLSRGEKSGLRGAVITAMKTLAIANGPLAIHTPHLVEDDESDDNGAEAKSTEKRGVMPIGMLTRIEALEDEAWEYIGGKRAPTVKGLEGTPLAKPAHDEEPELEGAGV
jgi:hypothetical protein